MFHRLCTEECPGICAVKGAYSPGVARMLRGLLFSTLLAALLPLAKSFGVLKVNTIDIFLIPLTGTIVLLSSLSPATSTGRVVWSRAEIALFSMFALMTLGACLSSDRANSANDVFIWARALFLYAVWRVLLDKGVVKLRNWARWYLFFGTFLAAVGLVQVVTRTPFGIVENYVGQNREHEQTFGVFLRISGTTWNSNVYGQWLVIFFLILNSRLLFSRSRSSRRLPTLMAVSVVELTLILGTLSRGTFLFFLTANFILAVVWIGVRPELLLLKLVGLLFCVTVVLLIGARHYQDVMKSIVLIERAQETDDPLRLGTLKYAGKLLGRPKVAVIGTGLGAFYPALFRYGLVTHGRSVPFSPRKRYDYRKSASGVHNVFVQLLVEGGVVVMFLYATFYLVTLRKAFRLMMRTRGTDVYWIAVYLFAILMALILVPMQVYESTIALPVLVFTLNISALVHHLDRCVSHRNMPLRT